MNDLRTHRKAAGLTQLQLAELAGTTQPQIRKLEAGDRKLTREWAERLAPHLGVTPQALLFANAAKAPVVGYVGAGMEVFGERVDDPEEVEIPPGINVPVEVVVVRGDSMYPVYRDGDRIVFEAVSRPIEELIGRECVVVLEDGRTLVKLLRRYGEAVVLESWNAPLITDVIIRSAWLVRWIERK